MMKQWYRVELSGAVVVEAESEDDATRQAEDATAEEAGLWVKEVQALTDDELTEHWGGDKDRIAAMFREDNRMQVALKRAKKMLEQRGIFIKGMDVFTPQFQVSMIENALKAFDAETASPEWPISDADVVDFERAVDRHKADKARDPDFDEVPKLYREGFHGGVAARLIEVPNKPLPFVIQTWNETTNVWVDVNHYENYEPASAYFEEVVDKGGTE